MTLRKISAVIAAALALTVIAPSTGAFPTIGTAVSAATTYLDLNVGDVFYATFDLNTGEVIGEPTTDEEEAASFEDPSGLHNNAWHECRALSDSTVCISTQCVGNEYIHIGCRITLPDEVGSYTVTEIEKSWDYLGQQGGYASITVPDTVTTINQSAFCGDILLEEINFGKNSQLKLIDQWAFQDYRSLKSIIIPASVETIAYGALGSIFECLDLKSVTLPASVETVDNYAFAATRHTVFDKTSSMTAVNVDPDNKNLKSVDGVLYTADGKKLVGCPPGKTGVNFADRVTEIQQGAFQGCNQITSVTIPGTITKLPIDAFALCIKLNKAVLPETLTEIGQWAFQYTALTDITIPESVTVIDPQAFEDSMLKNINGVEGSYAETFAKENGYTFNSVSSETNTFTDDSEDKAADIEVIAKPDVIPEQAYFSVRLDEENSTETRIAYNCYFTYNGEEYEPTDTVTVRIPIPVAMLDIVYTLKVYHLHDGKYVKMNVRIEDGYLIFETDHFSIYVVTADEIEENGGSGSGSTDTSDATSPSGSGDSGNTDNSGDKGNPDTGVVGITTTAVIAAAIVIYRKRK